MVEKSEYFDFQGEVRPAEPASRKRPATRCESRSSSRVRTSSSKVSRGEGLLRTNAFLLMSGHARGSIPQDRHAGPPGTAPRDFCRDGRGVAATSATVKIPSRASTSRVLAPTPHNAWTGRVCRYSTVRCLFDEQHAVGLAAGGGDLGHEFAGRDAHRCRDTRSRQSSCRRIKAPISRGVPSRRSEPLISRNASSTLSCSTVSVMESKAAMTSRRDLVVQLVPRLNDDGGGTHPHGRGHGHGRAHPQGTGLIGGRKDHRAPLREPHDDHLAEQMRALTEFDGDKKCVHVHVHDGAALPARSGACASCPRL